MNINYIIILLSTFVANVFSELLVWGALDSNGYKDIDESARLLAYSTCYLGFGFTRCKAEQADDDAVFRDDLPYYRNFDDLWGLNYCLQCCGENKDVDLWDLRCEYDSDTGPEINVYGYELRFARNSFPGDTGVTRCPIYRSACTYDNVTGRAIECATDDDNTYVHGIEATLWITKESKDFFSWRSVTKCEVKTIESNTSLETGDHFIERYILHHDVGKHEWSAFEGGLLFLISLAGIYIVLYYCRRQHCIICAKKLVFFKDRCYLCRFYGAHPPDPLMLKAMEEKGAFLQGEMPERFPGSKRLVRCCISTFESAKNCLKCCGKCFYYFTCCGCYCFRCCCKEKKIGDESSVRMDADDGISAVSSNPTAVNGHKAPKKVKVNPYLLKVHPWFLYKVLDHPSPPEAPEWVKRRLPEEDIIHQQTGDEEEESKNGGGGSSLSLQEFD